MITKWGLTNFKSIYEADIDLAPLTVLTGTNSSGKSALIQSMLMVAQTVRAQKLRKETNHALLVSGDLIDLGEFSAIRSFYPENENANDKSLGIRFTYYRKYEYDDDLVRTDDDKSDPFSLSLGNKSWRFEQRPIKPGKEKLAKEWQFDIKFSADEKAEPIVNSRKIKMTSYKKDRDVTRIDYESDPYEEKCTIVEPNPDKEPEEYTFEGEFSQQSHFIPESIGMGLELKYYNKELLDNYFYSREDDLERTKADGGNKINAMFEEIKKIKEFYTDHERFKYLGALREMNPFNKKSGSPGTTDVGVKGENKADVINENWDKEVWCFYPEILFTENPKALYVPLHKALSDWLEYFGVFSEITIERIKNYGFELKAAVYKENDFFVNITQVGTGMSQILPILVTCLLAKEDDSTIIIEEPEAHFHPKVQSRLADFFLSMALLGKQCIVETHSEYFIKRIQERIAQSPFNDNTIRDITKIYFVTKKGMKTSFEEVEINQFGGKINWPEGFMDESAERSASIMDAAAEKLEKAEKEGYRWTYDDLEDDDEFGNFDEDDSND